MDDVDAKESYEDDAELLDGNEAKESYEHDAELLDGDEATLLDGDDSDDTLSELAADNPEEDTAGVTPYCPHGLMDILLPAVPPRAVNARVIRRLKD